jgi:hypothetical protein
MATYKSDIYTIQSAATGDNRADARLISGKVRQATATVTLDSGLAATELINLVELPTGCLIDPSRSFIQLANPGTALVIDVGFASNADSLTPTALTVSAGGKFVFDVADDAPLITVAAGDELISITANTATTITGGTELRAVITYIDYN